MGRQHQWYKRKKLWIGAAALAAALSVAMVVALQFQPLDSRSHEVRYVTVRPGDTASEVGSALQQAHIIRSGWAFVMRAEMNGTATDLTAGVYRLSAGMSLGAILAVMRAGRVAVTTVSIPPGLTVQEIAERLTQAHIGSSAQYRVLLKESVPGLPVSGRPVRSPWEGYLYPATYSFPHGTTAREALMTMWSTFRQRVQQSIFQRARHPALTFVQWVTLASIIQREAGNSSQDPDVAAVFLNRLKMGMPLQSDATVLYAVGHPLPRGLAPSDFHVPSPYNTYLHKGLPPGPISDPSLTALRAALHPAHVSYLYFVSLPSGRILFAHTYGQQLANIQYADTHPHA